MRVLPALAIVIGVLMLAGCGKKATTVPDGAGSTAAGQGETGAAAGEGQVGEGRDLPGASGAAGGGPAGVANVIYFDFDRSDIRAEEQEGARLIAEDWKTRPRIRQGA